MFDWFKKKKKDAEITGSSNISKKSSVEIIGDATSFGYKSSWIAVKSDSIEDVAKTLFRLDKHDLIIDGCYNGWFLIHDLLDSLYDFAKVKKITGMETTPEKYWDLLSDSDLTDEAALNLIYELGKDFSEVCCFLNYRVSDCYMWAKFDSNHFRAFEFAMDYGVLVDLGEDETEQSLEESLGLSFSDYNSGMKDDLDVSGPDEEFVIELAEAWSVNPLHIDTVPGVKRYKV